MHLVGDVLEVQRDLVGVEGLDSVEAGLGQAMSTFGVGRDRAAGWATVSDQARVRSRSRRRPGSSARCFCATSGRTSRSESVATGARSLSSGVHRPM